MFLFENFLKNSMLLSSHCPLVLHWIAGTLLPRFNSPLSTFLPFFKLVTVSLSTPMTRVTSGCYLVGTPAIGAHLHRPG